MRWDITRGMLVAVAFVLSACGQVGLGPRTADSAPAAPVAALASQPTPDFRPFAGKTYAEFIAQPGMDQYAVASLGGTASEQARFTHAMATPAPGLVASGGGAEALIFSGCAPSGCLEGLSVVAINLATGEVFAGVSDMTGAEELAPNDRLEALLRLTSPSQSWDDPIRPTQAPG